MSRSRKASPSQPNTSQLEIPVHLLPVWETLSRMSPTDAWRVGAPIILSLGVVEQNAWTDNQQTHQYRLSYSTNFSRVGLSVYLSQTTYANGTPSVDSLGLTASVPLGLLGSASSLRASHNQVGTAQPTQSLSVSGSVGRDNAVGYSLTQSQTGDVGNASASMYY